MPNNFEKQVKEKMDELTFVPTAPVWEQIQKQIRAKKERRRFLLWLPIIILLTGSCILILRNGKSHIDNRGTVAIEKRTNNFSTPNYKEKRIRKNDLVNTGKDRTNTIFPVTDILQKHQVVRINNSNRYSRALHRKNAKEFRNSIANKPGAEPLTRLLQTDEPTPGLDNNEYISRPPVPYISERLLIHARLKLLIDSVKPRQVIPGLFISIDTPLAKAKQILNTKWQMGIIASAGFSGLSKGFHVFPASMQADVGSVSGSNNYNGYRNSPVTKNHAYAIGVRAKRNLSSRVSFALGVDYSYYSTQIKVGQKLQDTLIGLNNSPSRSYMGYGPDLKNYSNQYHFLSLPVSLEWKTGVNIPLYLEASFSLQQMIHTNGLIFNSRTGNYYTDQSAHNKTQLMTGLGLYYALLRSSLFFGPQAQFGLRQMEKNGSSNHLVYAGLQAHFFFKK